VKLTVAILAALILSSLVYGQTVSDPEHIIRRIVDDGISEGHDQKVIGGIGDAGAVLLTKILADSSHVKHYRQRARGSRRGIR
jgi:hypothetical protein